MLKVPTFFYFVVVYEENKVEKRFCCESIVLTFGEITRIDFCSLVRFNNKTSTSKSIVVLLGDTNLYQKISFSVPKNLTVVDLKRR